MSKDRSLREDFVLIVITSLLAFLGGAGGSYFTNALQDSNSDRQTRRENAKLYFEKRLQLVERTTKALNTALTTDTLQLAPGAELMQSPDFKAFATKLIESRLKVSELNTEIATVLMLDSLYFGPKTREALAPFYKANPNWSSVGSAEQNSLVQAMIAELFYGLPSDTAKP